MRPNIKLISSLWERYSYLDTKLHINTTFAKEIFNLNQSWKTYWWLCLKLFYKAFKKSYNMNHVEINICWISPNTLWNSKTIWTLWYYQVLTGIRVKYGNDFWPKFTVILTVTASISFISVTWKKVHEKYKDFKIRNQIQINLPHQDVGK